MMQTHQQTQISVPVTEQSQPASARRQAVALAQDAGMDERAIGNVALLVTELATNLVKHASCGELLIRRLGTEGYDGIEVLSLDKGPGIADIRQSLGDGYSTSGSPGTGLGSIQRTSAEFDLYSQPGKGTAVVARVLSRAASAPHAQAIGIVHQAKPGETVCGDDWVVRWFADGWICAVVDGLGHGLVAAQAARPIVDAMLKAPGHATPVELVEAAHVAAKPTRGAAFAVAVTDTAAGVLRFAGIGNIGATIMHAAERRHLVSLNGIVGHEYRKISEFSHPWHPGSLLVLYSDGIGTQWDLKQYPGLLSRDPSLIAGILYRDFTRGRDDATVVVVKNRTEN